MMSEQNEDRRKNLRVTLEPGDLPVVSLNMVKPFFQEPFEVEVQNVSSGGAMIYTQETIPLNSEFDIQLWLAGQPLTRQGKAVYKISSESGFAIGVSFVDPQKSKDATPSQPAKDFASEAWDWASGLD